MIRPIQIARGLALGSCLAFGLCAGARGQSPGLEVIDPPGNARNDPEQLQRQGFINLPANYLDQVLFGQLGINGKMPDAARERADAQVRLKVRDIDRICSLTAPQRARLEFAGRGDFERFMAEVEPLRRLFGSGKIEQAKFNNFWQEVQPLQLKFQKLLEPPDSLFAKVIDRTLSADQKARYAEVVKKREAYRREATARAFLAGLDGMLALNARQRKELDGLARRIEVPVNVSGLQQYAIYYELSRIPDAQLKAFFSAAQYKLLQPQLDQGRGLEMHLTRNGYVPLKEPVKTLVAGNDTPAPPANPPGGEAKAEKGPGGKK